MADSCCNGMLDSYNVHIIELGAFQHMSGISVGPLFLDVSRIATFDQATDKNPLAYETGFFYSNAKSELFLVKNRHVLIKENEGYIPNIARLTLHTNSNDLTLEIMIFHFIEK